MISIRMPLCRSSTRRSATARLLPIFGETRLRGVTVSDPDGLFLTSPEIELDWAPFAWLYNSLHIDRLEADKVRLHRLPKLKPTGRTGPILPGFDIEIGKLELHRLEVAKAVGGRERVGSVSGAATKSSVRE